VSIRWAKTPGKDADHLSIEWREEGGPPVTPPERKGFGTRMLGRIFDSERGGVTMQFEPSGLVCVLEVELSPRSGEEILPAPAQPAAAK